MQRRWIKAGIVSIAVAMVGCASSIEQVLPQNGKTMEQIYDENAGRSTDVEVPQWRSQQGHRAADAALVEYPPQAASIEHLYPKIENPDLFMYVRPHALGKSGSPVPAYITRFTLYRSTHYALPNETADTVPKSRGDEQ